MDHVGKLWASCCIRCMSFSWTGAINRQWKVSFKSNIHEYIVFIVHTTKRVFSHPERHHHAPETRNPATLSGMARLGRVTLKKSSFKAGTSPSRPRRPRDSKSSNPLENGLPRPGGAQKAFFKAGTPPSRPRRSRDPQSSNPLENGSPRPGGAQNEFWQSRHATNITFH